jgi:hypothetical protein
MTDSARTAVNGIAFQPETRERTDPEVAMTTMTSPENRWNEEGTP